MMPITRQDIEILLDTPDRREYVVSAYADLRVRDGFRSFVDTEVRNRAREVGDALKEAEARKSLDENIAVVLQAVLANPEPAARGMAVFAGVQRGLRRVIHLDFPVENRLVIDEEPYLLPLLERLYSEPALLVALIDSKQLVLFEAHAGVPEPVREIERPDENEEIQRDKTRFNYKKRFSQHFHERLQGIGDDKFLQDVAQEVNDHWKDGDFGGLILLGHATVTAPFRRLLHKDLQRAVLEESSQTMTDKPEEVADDVARAQARWREQRERDLLAELQQRWKERFLVANGPTEVLDALQQGRAAQVVIGRRRDLTGARCTNCGYRFGAPVEVCPYCQGRCATNNAVQEIMRMALRHRVPLHLFRQAPEADPLEPAGGVAALLRAEANWAPNAEAAQASEGHAGA